MIINLSDWDYKFIDFIKDSYNFYYKSTAPASQNDS